MALEPNQIDVQDEARLAELGYKQELRRDWTLMHNFGVSFSIIVSPQATVHSAWNRLNDEADVMDGRV
jgi:hypothetical protein